MLRAAVLLLLAVPVDAGVVYHYTTVKDDYLMRHKSGARVWIDGQRQRIELDPDPDNPRSLDVSISQDGGKTSTMINLQNGTFFRSDDLPGFTIISGSSPLLTMDFAQDHKLDKVSVQALPPVDGETMLGRPTKRHELRLSYRIRARVGDEVVEAHVEATFVDWSIDNPPVKPAASPTATGFADVDRQIEQWQATVGPGIVKQEKSIVRKIKGGQPIREFMRFVVDEIEERKIDPALFKIPAGLKYQLPIIGAPGK